MLRRRSRGGRWGFWLLGALVLVAAGSFAASRVLREDATAQPEVQAAENDAEWLQLIESAREMKDEPGTAWPEGAVPPGVTVTRSCREIPSGAERIPGGAIEHSPDGNTRRLLVDFRAADARYRLILYEGGDLSGCDPAVVSPIAGPDVYRDAVDAHVCEEMERMAGGLSPTDPTLRPASPPVAAAYLEAFCGQ